MNKKICFVIMGYGTRINPYNSDSLDLDFTYNKVIKPTLEQQGYICVRSDEITTSHIIDKNMYALLLCADLVIADISTHNPNALYELGVRHAIKPFSTIIMQEDKAIIPFDISHLPILRYTYNGKSIDEITQSKLKDQLIQRIKSTENISNKDKTDSPFYTHLHDIEPVKTPDNYYNFLNTLIQAEETLWAKTQNAKQKMKDKNFTDAALSWKKAHDINKDEIFYIQQWALCTYKSNKKDKDTLNRALKILSDNLDLSNTKDVETLGITGAIYKNLYDVEPQKFYLEKALEFYERGYRENYNYYNGENYILCNMMYSNYVDDEGKTYHIYEAKKAAKKIIELNAYDIDEQRNDIEWLYATLSRCYFVIGNDVEANKFKDKFLGSNPDTWKQATFNQNKQYFTQAAESI